MRILIKYVLEKSLSATHKTMPGGNATQQIVGDNVLLFGCFLFAQQYVQYNYDSNIIFVFFFLKDGR